MLSVTHRLRGVVVDAAVCYVFALTQKCHVVTVDFPKLFLVTPCAFVDLGHPKRQKKSVSYFT